MTGTGKTTADTTTAETTTAAATDGRDQAQHRHHPCRARRVRGRCPGPQERVSRHHHGRPRDTFTTARRVDLRPVHGVAPPGDGPNDPTNAGRPKRRAQRPSLRAVAPADAAAVRAAAPTRPRRRSGGPTLLGLDHRRRAAPRAAAVGAAVATRRDRREGVSRGRWPAPPPRIPGPPP